MYRTSIILGVLFGIPTAAFTLLSSLILDMFHRIGFPFHFVDSKLIWIPILLFGSISSFLMDWYVDLIKRFCRKQYLQMKRAVHLKSFRRIFILHRKMEQLFVFFGIQGLTSGIILLTLSIAFNKQGILLLQGCTQLCGSLFFILGLLLAKHSVQKNISYPSIDCL